MIVSMNLGGAVWGGHRARTAPFALLTGVHGSNLQVNLKVYSYYTMHHRRR